MCVETIEGLSWRHVQGFGSNCVRTLMIGREKKKDQKNNFKLKVLKMMAFGAMVWVMGHEGTFTWILFQTNFDM